MNTPTQPRATLAQLREIRTLSRRLGCPIDPGPSLGMLVAGQLLATLHRRAARRAANIQPEAELHNPPTLSDEDVA